jgi:cytochrome c-type biogenesis protein
VTVGVGVLGSLGPDGSVAWYLALGMVATVNPCGFAMLPAYLSYFLGLDPATASTSSTSSTSTSTSSATTGVGGGGSAGGAPSLAGAIRVALAVSAGFLVVFALAGLLVRQTSVPVYEYMPWISLVVGAGLVVLGIAAIAGFEITARLPKLTAGGRDRTVRSMFLFGLSYAVCSIGCTLPTFLSAVAGTMSRESLVDGLMVFALYGAGMAVVLTTLTVTMALARTSLLRFLRHAQAYVQAVSGVLVALAGLYVVYYGSLELRSYRSSGGNVPSSGVTDTVADWSYGIADWIRDTGSLRLTAAALLLLAATAVAAQAAKARRHERATAAAGPDPVDTPSAA